MSEFLATTLVCVVLIAVIGVGSGFLFAALGIPLWAYILLMGIATAMWSRVADKAAAQKKAEQDVRDAAKDKALNDALEELSRLRTF